MEHRAEKTASVLWWWTGREKLSGSVVCTLRIKEATPFFLKDKAYLYLTETVEWIWIASVSTDRSKSVNPCNRLNWVLLVEIDMLEGYPSLSPIACRAVWSLQSPRRVVR